MVELVELNRILVFNLRIFKSLKIEVVRDMYGLRANILTTFFCSIVNRFGGNPQIYNP